MIADERMREVARPHGIVAQGCHRCVHIAICGGIEPEQSLFDCFDHYCCNNQDGCDEVCPYNRDFYARLQEVGGLYCRDLGALIQPDLKLPRYIPLVHHGYSRRHELDLPMVALETYQVFRLRDGQYRALVADGAQLRQEFGLSARTRIILRGTARDRRLEQYWSYRRLHGAAEQMKALDILLAIGPNFSHFLDVPRTDNLFNRKRQLICLREMHEAGVPPVPHLSAVMPADWQFWSQFLAQSPAIKFVAAEFQTGNKNPVQGRQVITRLAALQESVGRRLHPLIVGGTQFVHEVASRFDSFSLIDSCPFIKAVKRQKFCRSATHHRWIDGFTLQGQGIEDILSRNIEGHSMWIDEQCDQCVRRKKVEQMM
jgi:hypothetical protein